MIIFGFAFDLFEYNYLGGIFVTPTFFDILQGRAHKERSGFEGPWTSNPLIFDNSYFTWVPFPTVALVTEFGISELLAMVVICVFITMVLNFYQGTPDWREGRPSTASLWQGTSDRPRLPPTGWQICCCAILLSLSGVNHTCLLGFYLKLMFAWQSSFQDEDAFFADYSEAHLKLSELG